MTGRCVWRLAWGKECDKECQPEFPEDPFCMLHFDVRCECCSEMATHSCDHVSVGMDFANVSVKTPKEDFSISPGTVTMACATALCDMCVHTEASPTGHRRRGPPTVDEMREAVRRLRRLREELR